MPSVYQYLSEYSLIKTDSRIDEMSGGVSLVRHMDEYRLPKPLQLACPQISINLGKLRIVVVDDVFPLELSAILVEAVSEEDGYVIKPRVSRSG